MRSLRTKITVITMSIVLAAVLAMSFISLIFIKQTEHHRSDQVMLLLCEAGQRNLEYYFNSVQKAVSNVAGYVEEDLDGVDDEKLSAHMERVRRHFGELATKANGVLTYYYRIDPEVSKTVKGFWYTDLDGKGFKEHEVTDITQYDTSDTSKLVWFTVPKYEGQAIWLPPYLTDTLNVKVISYNVPIFWRGIFVGVAGIEIDYTTMAEQVESIRLYNNGYAFLNNRQGDLFYHPYIDVANLTEETKPVIPDGLLSDSTFLHYTFENVEKDAVWMPLSNGMRLNVTAPVAETEGNWQQLIPGIIIGAVCVVLAAGLFVMFYTRRISRPLEQLTEAAEQADSGNYDYELTYENDDELGKLTRTFKRLSGHVRDNIDNLNKQVFIDALTNVKNKGAFEMDLEKLRNEIESGKVNQYFSLGVFDCDDLKAINDRYGHDKGDIYLQSASRAICSVFSESSVYRIGGDEFSVILRDDDYQNKEVLIDRFKVACDRINFVTDNEWEKVHISMGFADYDPIHDGDVSDVVRRADKVMYENKRLCKESKKHKASHNNKQTK